MDTNIELPADFAPWTPMGDGGQSQLDRILETLTSPRRRYTLYALEESNPQDLTSLTEAVLDWETDQPIDQVAENRREYVRVDLHHHQLPRLVNLRLVEYDPRTRVANYRDPPQQLEGFLDLCQQMDAE